MATPIDLLTHYEVGDILKADDVNALVDWAKRWQSIRGYVDNNTKAVEHKTKPYSPLHLKNDTGADIEPFSVFSIFNPGSSSSASSGTSNRGNDIARTFAQQFDITPNASPFLFVTNGSLKIPNNKEFEATLISFNQPTRLRANANDIPEVGEQCGISLGQMRVGKHGNGLVCLSPSWIQNDEIYVWVCRSREPIKVVGCVTSKITKAVKVNGKTVCGSGQLQIVYRNADNLITSVNRPAFPTSRWNVQVYNYSSVEYPVGMMVSATDTLASGLTVDYDQPNQLCRGSSSSSSSSSSRLSSSSSSSSSLSSLSSLSSSSLFSSSSSSRISLSSRSVGNTDNCWKEICGEWDGMDAAINWPAQIHVAVLSVNNGIFPCKSLAMWQAAADGIYAANSPSGTNPSWSGPLPVGSDFSVSCSGQHFALGPFVAGGFWGGLFDHPLSVCPLHLIGTFCKVISGTNCCVTIEVTE